jgi:hypothetical protein
MDGIYPIVRFSCFLSYLIVNICCHRSGTVILNANVAFLAIQSVDGYSSKRTRSPAQIASYLSLVTSAGAVILGLLLVRQNRTKPRETPLEAVSPSSRHCVCLLMRFAGQFPRQDVP